MVNEYVMLKLVHVFVAIVALGTSAGLGIVLEFYGDHGIHGAFVLRAITRLVSFIVLPGYLLMLLTGAWLTHLSWSFDTKWIQAALGLWGIGAVLLVLSVVALRKQSKLAVSDGTSSASYRRVALLSRILGGGVGLMVVLILYFMVVKPGTR